MKRSAHILFTRVVATVQRWRSALLVTSALACTAPALAVSYTFPGSLPAGCSGSGSSYTCGALTLAFGDTITIAAPKPATITVKGAMSTNNAQINTAGSATDLTIIVTGALTVGFQATLKANITAASVTDANGQVTFGGTLTTTSGDVTIGYQSQIAGNLSSAGNVSDASGSVSFGGSISTTTGTVSVGYVSKVAGSITTTTGGIALESNVVVNGSINSGSGSVQMKSAGKAAGSITTNGAVTLASSVVVSNDLVGGSGAIDVGYAATVGGVVSSTSGTINFGGINKVSSCVSSRSSSTITLGYGALVGGVCCGSTCGNSCVANNSGAAMPSSCALITYVSSNTTAAASDTRSITLSQPTGLSSGDLMLVSIAQRSSQLPLASDVRSVPSGWSLVLSTDDGANQGLLIYSKVATAPEPASYTWTMESSGRIAGGIAAFHGVDTKTPINARGSQSNAASTSYTAPSISATVKQSMLVSYYSATNGNGSVGTATAMTQAYSAGTGANSNGIVLGSSYANQVPLGATGSKVSPGNSALTNLGALLALTPAITTVSSVDHYELSLPSSSIACQPTTVTVTACTNSTSPCTNPATTLSGATAALSTTGATLGATSVPFSSEGIATTTLSYPAASQGAAVSVTLSGESTTAANARQCCQDGVKCATADSCSTTFNTAGFIISSSTSGSAATLPTQTAGTASGSYYLRAVQTNTSTGACTSALTGSSTVNWAYQCNNPTTCSAGNLMAINGGAATAISGNPNSGVSGYSAVAMTFDAGGNAPFSFTYGDVGQVTLYANKSASGSLLSNLSGSSNAFVVKPANLVISNIKQTALPNLVNPAAADGSGAKFVTAGEAFTATVTAQTSGNVATPNFGRETPAEGVLVTPTLVLPSSGTTGALSNNSIAGGSFSSGAATVSTLAYSEVGIVTLSASLPDGDYLGAGNLTGTASANVGRFIPAKFVLSSPSVTHRSGRACSPASTFTHLDENFSLRFTLTAQNTSGTTTANYSGSFAKLDPTAASGWNVAGLGGTTSFSTTSGRLSLGTATGSWTNGVASGVSVIANAARAATPDGPFNASFGIAPTDSDGVAMSAFDMASTSGGSNDRTAVASIALRFGRLRLSSAVGPADRTLALPVTAQYWSGSTWNTNTLDSCTTVPTSALNFGNLMRTITSADTAASSGITIAGGLDTLKLTAPGGGRSGTYDVALSLGSSATDASCLQTWTPTTAATAAANLAYLRGAWCGSSYAKDPSARVTFGQQSTQQNLIYRRENY